MLLGHNVVGLLLASVGLCIAKGGRGGGGGGGGRGGSAARASVSSSSSSGSGYHGSSSSGSYSASSGRVGGESFSSSSSRSQLSSTLKGAAVGVAVGVVAGAATSHVLSSYHPITMGHNTYYWSNHYSPSNKRNMVTCSFNLSDDPIFNEFEFDNSTDNSTRPEQLMWECPAGMCDLQNMTCRETDKSTIVLAGVIIVVIIMLTVCCAFYGRMKKRCAQNSERRRRQDYEIESRGGGPVDGMAPLPRTPIPRSPVRRPYSAKI